MNDGAITGAVVLSILAYLWGGAIVTGLTRRFSWFRLSREKPYSSKDREDWYFNLGVMWVLWPAVVFIMLPGLGLLRVHQMVANGQPWRRWLHRIERS